MYKVLDVREYQGIDKGSFSTSLNSNHGTMSVSQTHYVVVICQDTETAQRKRFIFYDGYENEFLGKTHYYGYQGCFSLLVPGDTFEIEETSTFDRVKLLNT